jgi:predicted DNA-binding protein (MmcQ/YjbR family)
MNKKHWNTVMLNGSVPDKDVFSRIDHSYDLITRHH